MKKYFKNGEYVEFDKDELDREKLGRSKNGEIFDKYLKVSNLILILIFLLNSFINSKDIYFKENFLSLMSIILIIQVVATGARIIYKAFISKSASKSFLILGGTCFLIVTLIKGGLTALDDNMVEYFAYSDSGRSIVVNINIEDNKIFVFKEINPFMMKNLGTVNELYENEFYQEGEEI